MQSIEDFATDLARRAGQLILELRAGSNLEKHFKGGIEIVTQADIAADELIAAEISARFPSIEFCPRSPRRTWGAFKTFKSHCG
jgi:fructose-1,6-bisphosphatase/inositol monophosphatase family enzyme